MASLTRVNILFGNFCKREPFARSGDRNGGRPQRASRSALWTTSLGVCIRHFTAEGWQVVSLSRAVLHIARDAETSHTGTPSRRDQFVAQVSECRNRSGFSNARSVALGLFSSKRPLPHFESLGRTRRCQKHRAQTLRDLIDPASPNTRSPPNSEQDLVIAAMHNHVLNFDSLSTIRLSMAYAFCRIATGGGLGTRKLHTDVMKFCLTPRGPACSTAFQTSSTTRSHGSRREGYI